MGHACEYSVAADIRPAVPEMQRPAADLRVRPRRCPFPGPRVVGGFVNVVLELVECLRGNAGDAVLIGLAVGIEVVPQVRA